jgi:hypothetical protein
MAVASSYKGEKDRQHIAVIGDGAMTAGLAFEGLNHGGVANSNLLVVLNDNCMSIDPNVGALKEYLTDITTSHTYNKVKDTISYNYCSNFIGGLQNNIYRQNPNCFKNIHKSCYNDITKKYDEKCLDILYKNIDIYNDENIEQTNIDIQYAECNINSILGILSQGDITLQNLAIIKLFQEEQQKNKKSTSDYCSEISSDITKEQFIRSFLSCTNMNIAEQNNIINSECNPTIFSQMNINRSIDKCIVDSNIVNKSGTQVTQRIVKSNDISNSSQNDDIDLPKNNTTNPTNNTTNPTNNTISNNQIGSIIIIVCFIGFIIMMVLFFLFRR